MLEGGKDRRGRKGELTLTSWTFAGFAGVDEEVDGW